MTLPETLHIRPMTERDLEAVMALEREVDGAPHWSRAEYLGAIEHPADSALRRVAIMAEVSGRFAGFAVVRLLTTRDGGEAELESIVVAPELRGRGIGTALLAEVICRAKAQGARQLDLEVRASNAAAFRLYERLGLSETGRRQAYYRHPDEDAALMRIDLRPG